MEKQEEQLLATLADYQRTFKSPHGKKVLRHLMRQCGMMMPSMDMHKPEPLGMAFNDGRRSVVIEILEKLRLDLKKLESEIINTKGDDDVII